MALSKNINPSSKINNDTGFGTNASSYGGRFLNKDGSYNLAKEGLSNKYRFSIYHSMLNMPRWKFAVTIICFFIGVNCLFTLVYVILGINNFQGFVANTSWGKIRELLYFSTETFTTVGYGRVNPIGDGVNIVAAFEAMLGFLSFAIATGLIYGRFSKPRSYLLFSENALIAPYKENTGFMFRLVSYKDNHNLTNAEIKVSVGFQVQENGNATYKFYSLNLERNRVDNLMMNWTVVHPIDDESPLKGFTLEDMKNADLEVYVQVRGFDDVYSNIVNQRTSYTYDEVIFDAKFVPMFRESDDGKLTIVELNKLNEIVRV